jgi:hypothetical protein
VVANVLEINPERWWASLERSAEIGRFRELGLRRLALSAEDKQMRDLFPSIEYNGFFCMHVAVLSHSLSAWPVVPARRLPSRSRRRWTGTGAHPP